jgi:glutamine amidotransferase
MIAIIDYDAGNLRSVFNAFEAIGQKAFITRDPAKLKRAKAIVLPGVGAFGDGMASLKRMNLIEVLNEEIVEKKKPYLGICLGMQFLANESEELGNHRGLGWIDGSVRIIRPNDPKFRIPHIGWNNIEVKKKAPLFEGFSGDPVFYFVHSYHLEPEGSPSATCWHGTTVTASIQKDNIFGVQFHPEKSQKEGLKVLENFVKII